MHPNRLPIAWHALSCSHQWQKWETLEQSEQVVWAAQVLFFFFGGSLHVLPQAQPWMLPRAWQVSDFSHQWQVCVFVQSLQDVRSLQDVLFRPRKSGAPFTVLFAYRVRSDVSAAVAETRPEGRLEIEFKPRMVVVQRTKRGIRCFNMIQSLGVLL